MSEFIQMNFRIHSCLLSSLLNKMGNVIHYTGNWMLNESAELRISLAQTRHFWAQHRLLQLLASTILKCDYVHAVSVQIQRSFICYLVLLLNHFRLNSIAISVLFALNSQVQGLPAHLSACFSKLASFP